ncbi:uncharacterized protein BX664DRAFT_352872 [Halteromyces radiatus]|nr:uncharacterized protein BX664DRAFT_352872 [Halteromyces radiatus]KAI8081770.1 hypothetical protein BX664DRAFT_352872 [Halteromyces radiatus]
MSLCLFANMVQYASACVGIERTCRTTDDCCPGLICRPIPFAPSICINTD